MKNWVLFSVITVLVLSIVIAVGVLYKAHSPITNITKKAEAVAIESGKLVRVGDSYTYNGSNPYITVIGEGKDGEQKAVFVPISLEEELILEVELADGISEQEAIATLSSEQSVKKVLHTKLGYEQAGAVWEVSYMNEADKLNYVYVLFEDGKWWKRILNL